MFGDTAANESKIEADEVQWEYKESKDGDLIGPCSTAKMLKVKDNSLMLSIFGFSSKGAITKIFWLEESTRATFII